MFFIILLIVAVVSSNPGVRLNFLEESISSTIDSFVPYVENLIKNFKIPDIQEQISSPVGNINLKVSNMYVSYNTFRLSKPPVTFSANTMSLQDTVFFGVGDGNWGYSSADGDENLSGSGTFEANLCLHFQSFDVILKRNTSLKTGLEIDFQNVAFDIRDFSLNIHGGQSWFIGFFKSFIENKIKDVIYTEFYGTIPKKLPQLIETELSKIIDFPILSTGMILDLVVDDVGFKNDYLTLSSEGIFKYKSEFLNGTATSFPLPLVKNEMISLTISEYTVNSALYLSSKLDLLDVTLTEKDLPASVQKWIKLNTSWIGWIFIPELDKKFPDKEMDLKIQLSVQDFPSIQFTEKNQVLMDIHLDISFQVILDDHSVTDAFVVETFLSLNVSISKLWATQDEILLILQLPSNVNSFSMKLLKSQIGQFKISSLETLVKFIIPEAFTVLNDWFQKNPFHVSQKEIPFFRVVSPIVTFGNGFMEFDSNFTVNF